MEFVSQRYDAICFANCFASYSMRKSALRKRGRRLEQIANCFASYNMRRFTLCKRGRRLEQIANFFASYNMRRSALCIYAFLLTCCFMGTVQEVQEEDHNCRNDNGPGAWQGASFWTCWCAIGEWVWLGLNFCLCWDCFHLNQDFHLWCWLSFACWNAGIWGWEWELPRQ
jgi:hypothetical protein